MSDRSNSHEISGCEDTPVYSFCTLVTNKQEYDFMVEQFVRVGFSPSDCEFLYIDNSLVNRLDSYSGYNRFLQRAAGKYVILCHQDIVPISDGRTRLDDLTAELSRIDPNWAVCGNAGADSRDNLVIRISDPWGKDRKEGGPFPKRVVSLDENFILVRGEANLALSRDLTGYHWYGTDICIVADVLGWNSYVIDFHIEHKSGGTKDPKFFEIKDALKKKYRRAFRPRWQFQTTREPFYISSSQVGSRMAEMFSKIKDICLRVGRKLFR